MSCSVQNVTYTWQNMKIVLISGKERGAPNRFHSPSVERYFTPIITKYSAEYWVCVCVQSSHFFLLLFHVKPLPLAKHRGFCCEAATENVLHSSRRLRPSAFVRYVALHTTRYWRFHIKLFTSCHVRLETAALKLDHCLYIDTSPTLTSACAHYSTV